MKRFNLTIPILFGLASFVTLAQTEKPALKLKRADCFFGIHFDLHASEDITDAGKTLTAEMIDTFLTRVRPDFIQVDCKGHPGISSYPTKVGYHVKGFEKNPLRLWREVTEKNNVALFLHFSGVWDSKVVKEHPDWAIVKDDGERSKEKTSFFSPYLDTYMIPQLMELSDYKVRVLPGRDGTAARVRVLIESRDENDHWGTVGVSHDILEASWQALVDSINYKMYKAEK
jgi:hypothetical protein